MTARKTMGAFRFGVAQVRYTAQIAGRTVIQNLPLSHDKKIRLKYAILSVVGPLFGVKRGVGELAPTEFVGESALKITSERYRVLAASARGLPTNVPERSVSIIVPVYNQISYTLACIEALKENTGEIDHEIIVVDDCSTDQTNIELGGRDDITYLRNEKNLGFIGSCNAGARIATKNYVCFLNNDTKVLPYWLSALVNTFELHENVGLAGSKLIYPDGRLQEAGGLIWNDGSGWNWGKLQDPNDMRFNYARAADYCSGASIVLPRALFQALGGFDAHYTPAYGEDSDLAFKIRSLGLSTLYQPLSQVVHFEGITSGTDTTQGVKKYQVDNAKKLAARWSPVLKHQGEPGVNPELVSDRGVAGRILVLDQITPEPDRDAGSITALELMRALRDLGHKINFIPCSNLCHISPYTELLASLGIESILLPWTKSIAQHLSERGGDYDAVLLFRPLTWHDHIDDIRKYAPQAKVIYHSSDLHFLREQRASDVGHGASTGDAGYEAAKKAELDLLASADLCIVHSTLEKELIEELRPGSSAVCFPWIYEPRGIGEPFEKRKGLIFVGGYGHPPNVDAVEHYVSKIHPLLAGKLPPGADFAAVGSSPPPSMMALEKPGITIPGFVDDISPVFFGARVMVVPLRYGAGIKGKIISAMAHGLPMVTTSVGAEGMGLIHEEHVLIADEPEEFAAAVERLYHDADLWKRLQSAGLEYVRQTTSREAGLQTVSGLLQQLGLPYTARQVPEHIANEAGSSSAFGTRWELTDAAALVAAARLVAGETESAGELVVLPDELGPLDPGDGSFPNAVVCLTSELPDKLQAAKTVLVVADATDSGAAERLGQALAADLAGDAQLLIAFAPPRLSGTTSGYRILAPFSQREVEPIPAPFHEKHDRHLQFANRKSSWLIDTSLTGFPSTAILRVEAVRQTAA